MDWGRGKVRVSLSGKGQEVRGELGKDSNKGRVGDKLRAKNYGRNRQRSGGQDRA